MIFCEIKVSGTGALLSHTADGEPAQPVVAILGPNARPVEV